MSSLFDLKTSASQLPSINQGCAKYQYHQISSTAPVEGKAFPGAPKRFRWDVSGNTWWVPSKSYLRTRFQITQADGVTQPVQADNIAVNMDPTSNLFQSMTFKMNGKTISRVEDNVPQISSINTRLSKSGAWLDTVGASSNFWQPYFDDRRLEITSDVGPSSSDLSKYVFVDHITLGYAATVNIAIDSGDGTIIFTVGQPDCRPLWAPGDILLFSRTATNKAYSGQYFNVTTVAADRLTVIGMSDSNSADLGVTVIGVANNGALAFSRGRVNAASPGRNIIETCYQPPLSVFNYAGAIPAAQLELELTTQTTDLYKKAVIESINASKVPGAGGQFDVDIISMYFYACTVEGPRADNVTYYMSLDEVNVQPTPLNATASLQKFQFDVSPSTYALSVAFQNQGIIQDTTKSASKLRFSGNTTEQGLDELYVQAFGTVLPSPPLDVKYNATTDNLTRMYMDNVIANGSLFDSGGGESKADWLERGLYYYIPTPKDASSESTRVYVNCKFPTAPLAGEANVLLYSHYKKMIAVSVVNGQTTSVLEADQ
jgi:hypothetical protein